MGKTLLRLGDTPLHEEREWSSDGIVVLTAEVTLPRCGGRSRAARRFDRYYRRCASAYLAYCDAELAPRAEAAMRAAMEHSAPWERPRAALDYTVTLESAGLLSLYTEGREEHLAPRLTLRRAETWDMSAGLLAEAADFFPHGTPLRRLLAARAREMAASESAAFSAAYYPSCRVMLRRALNLRNFYLTPDAFHWFYPMYTVAPASKGIPDFSLPLGDAGFFLPPEG